jgi:hypothetical protein
MEMKILSDEEILHIAKISHKATSGMWYEGEYDSIRRDKDYIVANNRDIDCIEWLNDYDIEHIINTCPSRIIPLLEEILFLRNQMRRIQEITLEPF